MTKEEFRQFVITSGEFFGLKNIVEKSRFDLWFKEVQHIPSAALPYIQSMLFSEKDIMPRNMPKFIKDFYGQWLNANPDKVAYRNEHSVCDECRSTGFIWFKKHDGNTYVCRCGRCQNWARALTPGAKESGVPVMMIRDFILESGWTLIK